MLTASRGNVFHGETARIGTEAGRPAFSFVAFAEKGSAMETKAFKPRSKDYWAGRATERRYAMDHPMTIGPASDVRRIDPETGEVIEDIESEENARLLTGPRWPRSSRKSPAG